MSLPSPARSLTAGWRAALAMLVLAAALPPAAAAEGDHDLSSLEGGYSFLVQDDDDVTVEGYASVGTLVSDGDGNIVGGHRSVTYNAGGSPAVVRTVRQQASGTYFINEDGSGWIQVTWTPSFPAVYYGAQGRLWHDTEKWDIALTSGGFYFVQVVPQSVNSSNDPSAENFHPWTPMVNRGSALRQQREDAGEEEPPAASLTRRR